MFENSVMIIHLKTDEMYYLLDNKQILENCIGPSTTILNMQLSFLTNAKKWLKKFKGRRNMNFREDIRNTIKEILKKIQATLIEMKTRCEQQN